MSLSKSLFEEAKQLIPGGVNSPIRSCKAVHTEPVFIDRAKGSRIWDVDGNEYIDYVMSWGPMLLGHCHPAMNEAVIKAVGEGSSFGAPCPAEVELARLVTQAVPSIEMVRMVNSGTEATMSALRLARGYTGRDKVVKFEGCYHGHADAYLCKAGSGAINIPGTPGVPAGTVADTLLAPFNDLEAVKELFAKQGKEIAAIIVEPIPGNMGCILPAEGFLQGLRDLTEEYGAVLIFDEVISGFRASYGGAQELYGITPDLTTLGKIIGGGFPVGAFGGKREIMERMAPVGDVFQAGTLSGNPVAMAAGATVLKLLKDADYDALGKRTLKLANDMMAILEEKGLPVSLNHVSSMFTIFFTKEEVTNFASAMTSDAGLFASFFLQMRDHGVSLAPLGFECAFTSFAHTEEDYEKTLEAVRASF